MTHNTAKAPQLLVCCGACLYYMRCRAHLPLTEPGERIHRDESQYQKGLNSVPDVRLSLWAWFSVGNGAESLDVHGVRCWVGGSERRNFDHQTAATASQPAKRMTTNSNQSAGKAWYLEKLKRPEWQKKRLAVMNHAKFRCQICGSKHKTLNVHHSYYARGKEPWQYPTGSMICVCEECHKKIHPQKVKVEPYAMKGPPLSDEAVRIGMGSIFAALEQLPREGK